MTRDAITVQLPTQDGTQSVEVISVTKQAVTQANGISVSKALENKNNSLQISIENTYTVSSTATASSATIKAGDKYPNKMLGDLTVTLGAGKTTVIILDDIARFENKDGSVNIDFASGFTGNIWATAKRAGLVPAS